MHTCQPTNLRYPLRQERKRSNPKRKVLYGEQYRRSPSSREQNYRRKQIELCSNHSEARKQRKPRSDTKKQRPNDAVNVFGSGTGDDAGHVGRAQSNKRTRTSGHAAAHPERAKDPPRTREQKTSPAKHP